MRQNGVCSGRTELMSKGGNKNGLAKEFVSKTEESPHHVIPKMNSWLSSYIKQMNYSAVIVHGRTLVGIVFFEL